MDYTVKIHIKNGLEYKTVSEGQNLLKFLNGNSYILKTPCGGNGTCGKCSIKVSGLLDKPTEVEKKLLGVEQAEKGYRLACYCRINSNIEIYSEDKQEEAKIITYCRQRKVKLNPLVSKKFISLKQPDISDQNADEDRVTAALDGLYLDSNIRLLGKLTKTLKHDDYKVTLFCEGKKIIDVEAGDTTGNLFGLAVDIGTTTVAAYLFNLVSGERTDVFSVLNPQKKYGADVISRIDYTMKSADSLSEMNKTIIDCINNIISVLSQRNNIDKKSIYEVVFAGNTTMLHFLMNLPAAGIAVSPFIPVTTGPHTFKAIDLSIDINPKGSVIILPSVSAYIGADTTAAVLAGGIYSAEKMSLIIDIGTNGEMVLGNKKRMISCSTAAGPAFEGANIRNGTGGITGAIDSIKIASELEYTTIGNRPAVGLCGSGLVDAIAAMLSLGIIDETGRILNPEEIEGNLPHPILKRLVKIDNKTAFVIEWKENCESDSDIAITQKDVREFQNAKAAIAAGIKILASRMQIKTGDIQKAFLAGGFGSYINVDSAHKVGLLPDELRGRVESIGNAAGEGAVEALLSSKRLGLAEKIRNRIEYIELSTAGDFSDEYIECLMF